MAPPLWRGGKEYDYGGAWGLNLVLNYRKTFEVGKFTVKITPNLLVDVQSKSEDFSFEDKKKPKGTWFTLEPGIQLGVKYQPSDKFAFFTGIDFSLLQWNTHAMLGGDKEGTIFVDKKANNIGDWAMATLGDLFTTFSLIVTYTF